MKKDIPFSKSILIFLITVISAFIFMPYIRGTQAFIIGWDMRTIYSSNFENLRTMLQGFFKHGTLPFWTWFSFLGNDFYSSKLFYFNDFFEIPFALTKMRYDHAIMIMTYLKFLIAGLGFHAYVKYHKYSNSTAIISSLMYAFNAYHLYVMMNPFLGSFLVFLPYYFLSVDRYIKEKKYIFFIVMVFFLFLNNYYLFYSVSLFTILYFIYRWMKEYKNPTGLFKEAFKLIGFYVVGFLLSGIVVLPEVFNILGNSRVGQRSSLLIYESLLPYFDYLLGTLVPASAFANRATPISKLFSYTTSNESVMTAYLWASSVLALLWPQLLSKKHRDKTTLISLLVITIVALVPILSSVMHGFSEPSFRWLASVTFLLIVCVLPFIENPEEIDRNLLKKTIIVFGVCMFFMVPFLSIFREVTLEDLAKEIYLPLLFLPTLLLIGFALYHNRKPLLLSALVIELCIASYMSCYGSPDLRTVSKEDYQAWMRIMGAKNEYTNFTKELESDNPTSFYRTYIDASRVYWGVSTSFNLDFNIMGLMAYDSTYLPSMNDLIELDPERVQHYLPWTFKIENPDVMNLVSTKYAVVTEEQYVPFKNYEYVTDYYGKALYKNLDYVNLGKTYTQLISYDEYSPTQSDVLNDTIIAHSEDLEEIQSLLGKEVIEIDSVNYQGNRLNASIHANENGFLVISVPYDKGWKVKLNGKKVETYCVSGGMTGLAIQPGENIIAMKFTPRGFTLGIFTTLLGILLFIGVILLKRKPL